MNPRNSAIAVPYSVYWISMPRNSTSPVLKAIVTPTSHASSTASGTSKGPQAVDVLGSRDVIMGPVCVPRAPMSAREDSHTGATAGPDCRLVA